jgi:alditol oxidase
VTGRVEMNWARNHVFRARRILRPRALGELQEIVRSSPRVHAIGARHSFNDVADCTDTLVDLSDMEDEIEIAADGQTAVVGAGASYGAVAAVLHARGYALHNMGSLPHITIAGATATGTHGSGDRNGSLATAVAALELVDARGELVTVRRGEPDFDGMVVGLGAFGIITRVTLDIQPSFLVRQDAFVRLPWDTLLSRLDEVFSCAYSVSVMTKWSGDHVDRLWLKTRVEDQGAQEVTAAHLGVVPGAPHASAVTEDVPARLNPFGGVPGPWSERLAHFRPDHDPGTNEQIQSECLVPRRNAATAIEAVRHLAARIDPLLITTEIRTVAADGLWLSGSYGEDAVGVHFTWKRDAGQVAAITREIEDLLIPLGGRPHWGKLMHARAAVLAPLYPRMDAFRALVQRRDPGGRFRNAFLERHVFGEGEGAGA